MFVIMLKIEKGENMNYDVEENPNNFSFTRGDEIHKFLRIKNYTFGPGDIIKFNAYNKREMSNTPVLSKTFIVENDTDVYEMIFTSEETKIGEMQNKPIILWYEIELNEKFTVIGFKDNNPTTITLYPEGADKK